MLSSQYGDIWSQSCRADISLRGMSQKCRELEQISGSALPLQRLGAGTDLSAPALGTRVAPTGHFENWQSCPGQDAEPTSSAQAPDLPLSLLDAGELKACCWWVGTQCNFVKLGSWAAVQSDSKGNKIQQTALPGSTEREERGCFSTYSLHFWRSSFQKGRSAQSDTSQTLLCTVAPHIVNVNPPILFALADHLCWHCVKKGGVQECQSWWWLCKMSALFPGSWTDVIHVKNQSVQELEVSCFLLVLSGQAVVSNPM